ncbi:MAG: AAA family ATPase, partial [Hyphomicrobiales bacterium]|nr:AAA family ATPase [Hyphomicrobiales bacterium]
FASVMAQAVEMAASAQGRDSGLSGLSTGISSLDKKLGGLQPSDLIVLAGRPSMGKSALATNVAFHVAQTGMDTSGNDGGAVGFFSLEMSAEQVATRILSERAGIASENIRRGAISEAELGHFTRTSAELEKLPLYIDHTGAIPVATLAARARRLMRENDLKLIVVDYLQLATADKRRNSDGRVQEIAEITQSLKALAKQLNIPVLALSQLSRQVESRDDKRPQLSDLRESGAIEQDADVVLFIYREEYYLEQAQPEEGTTEHLKWREKMERAHGLAELLVSKQRHGSTGTIRLQFQADVTRFSDFAPSSHVPEATY